MKNTKTEKSKEPTQRQLRVAEELRHIIGKMLSRDDLFIDGLNPGFIMVTRVIISPDLSYATVFIQTIGTEDTDLQIKLLNRHKGVFRYQIGRSVRLRIVPDLVFKSDARFEHSKYIDDLLNSPRVRTDLEKEPESNTK